MTKFCGLLNDNGRVDDITIYYDFNKNDIGDFFIGKIRADIVFDDNTCVIRGVKYDFSVETDNNEIIIYGREKSYCLVPWLYRPKFFVVSFIYQ